MWLCATALVLSGTNGLTFRCSTPEQNNWWREEKRESGGSTHSRTCSSSFHSAAELVQGERCPLASPPWASPIPGDCKEGAHGEAKRCLEADFSRSTWQRKPGIIPFLSKGRERVKTIQQLGSIPSALHAVFSDQASPQSHFMLHFGEWVSILTPFQTTSSVICDLHRHLRKPATHPQEISEACAKPYSCAQSLLLHEVFRLKLMQVSLLIPALCLLWQHRWTFSS